MKRIAIIGGGISGLTAAYELELARRNGADIDWHLYEASNRLGGIIETTRLSTPEGDFILEGGPDGWVSEKPWARDLAIELGLESELIYSNDATRKTYILQDNQLQPIPDKMRLMVPEDLSALDNSPLFTPTARAAYAAELANAAQLKSTSPFADPSHDESVATFVLRHFGPEVLEKLAAPLLSGVFGGDVHKLSARAVMPQLVAIERDHGSLIAGLQAKAKQRSHLPPPIFTSLRNGMATLVKTLSEKLPPERIHLNRCALSLKRERGLWCLRSSKGEAGKSKKHFHHIFLAASLDATRDLIGPLDPRASSLLTPHASSAVLATFCWPSEDSCSLAVPHGFGFLVPQAGSVAEPQILACTFVHQKFPHRAPGGGQVLRVFFGGASVDALTLLSDQEVAALAFQRLTELLGQLPSPDPEFTRVRRWPRSLPQYEVGHLDRVAQLDALIAKLPGLHLLGNSYRGVGLPDLIRDARDAARSLIPNT